MISLSRDSKGPCWIISHKRCGITETMFITPDELKELTKILERYVTDTDF